MRFKIDENLPEDVASVLVDAGHDAVTVLRQKLGGTEDPKIARICQSENRVPSQPTPALLISGPILQMSIQGLSFFACGAWTRFPWWMVVKRLLPSILGEQLERRLWVVEETRVRIRGEV